MTQAVAIREYQDSDVDDVVAAVQESVAELQPWMSWASSAYSRTDAAAWVDVTRHGRATSSMYTFAVIDSTGRYVGGCGINQINHVNGVANLGYWIRSSAVGHGLATAAVRRVVAWALAHTALNRFEIVVAVENTRSQRVAEKAGAHRDAVLKKRVIVAGRPCDAVLFSILRPD
jgi:ribosomal-protein-serine acetyltransferase